VIARKSSAIVPPSTPTERTFAAGMHIATIFFPIIAPVVVLIGGRSSAFVTAHAKRSLTETLVVQGVLLIMGAISLTYSLVTLYGQYQNDWKDFSITAIILKAVVAWAIVGLLEVVNTIQALRMALRAYRGDLA